MDQQGKEQRDGILVEEAPRGGHFVATVGGAVVAEGGTPEEAREKARRRVKETWGTKVMVGQVMIDRYEELSAASPPSSGTEKP